MRQIGNVIGVAPAAAPVLPRATHDPEGRAYSIMDSTRIAQCQMCFDVGWHKDEYDQTVQCVACNGGKRFYPVADLCRIAKIPDELYSYTLQTWLTMFPEHEAIHRALSAFAAEGMTRSGARGLYIHGSTGTGKTGASVATLSDMLPRAVGPARYIYWPDWLDSIKETWQTDRSLTVAEVIHELNKMTILVVDEFGGAGEGSTEWKADVARRLTDARALGAASGKVTIWTSQLDLDGITREFLGPPIGAAIASRIMGHCTVFEIVGYDGREREYSRRHGEKRPT